LCGKGKDIDDYRPARLDVDRFSSADIRNTSNDKVFDVRPSVHVVQHDLLEGFQEVLLEVE
jgi:hypothetical protein